MFIQRNLVLFLVCLLIFGFLCSLAFNSQKGKIEIPNDWCDKSLRPGLKKLKEIKTSRPWFKVYDVGHNTYAIDEPYNWEETIGYLILGKEKALLFDSGMGLDSISPLIREITQLPIIVLNSHTHPDHIGGNYEFNHILALNTPFTRQNAKKGYKHEEVNWEISPASFCLKRLLKMDTAHYYIKPFKVTQFIEDGYVIQLGSRSLKVIATPGHTPDALCLLDKKSGYLWCGDSFYEGPILLSSDVTDLKAYQKSIKRMADLASVSIRILPAHNLPIANPSLIIQAAKDFDKIALGLKKALPGENHTSIFDCGTFSYQISNKFLKSLNSNKLKEY